MHGTIFIRDGRVGSSFQKDAFYPRLSFGGGNGERDRAYGILYVDVDGSIDPLERRYRHGTPTFALVLCLEARVNT